MPKPLNQIINALNDGSLDFADVREALHHRTDTIRVHALWAMAKLAQKSSEEGAAAVAQLRTFALTPENQGPERLGPPLSYMALEALLRSGDELARRAAQEVYESVGDVERAELDAYLTSRGVRL